MRTQRPPSASVRQTPQRARIDANGTGNPRAVAKRVYSREFIARIGNEFGFDPFEGNRVDDLRWFARTYILNRRLESKWDERARLRRSGKSYGEFHEVTQDFLSWLKKSYGHADFYNIATEMLFVARSRREPEPQNNFPKLTEHQRRTEAHYRELLRLTEILAATLARGLRESEPPRGPIPDQPLRHFVSSCAGFWMYDLGRPFTIDYAKGSGTTRAFEFVMLLLKRIDDIPDRRLVTAMRAERKHLNRLADFKRIKPGPRLSSSSL